MQLKVLSVTQADAADPKRNNKNNFFKIKVIQYKRKKKKAKFC